jgi:Xaa-Pro aminopeptidase
VVLQVRFLAWLEFKLSQGYEITEYEAASRLTEFRRKNKYFMGLAYENISASGPNAGQLPGSRDVWLLAAHVACAALPHYSPTKSKARMIDRENPYLK